MSHEVEIKYRINAAERERLLTHFGVRWPATGEWDLRSAAGGAQSEIRSFLADHDLWPSAGEPVTPFPLTVRTWVVYDRYFFDYRHLLFRVRLMVDSARGDTHAEITHKQADHVIGEALNRMEVNLPISSHGVRDGDLESVLKLMELMNFRPVLVMKKERIYLKMKWGEAAPIQSLLCTIDQVAGAVPDTDECQRPPSRENERTWVPIGDYVEVEAMVADAGNVDFAGKVVADWGARLDLTRSWVKEKTGYFGLAARKLGAPGV